MRHKPFQFQIREAGNMIYFIIGMLIALVVCPADILSKRYRK